MHGSSARVNLVLKAILAVMVLPAWSAGQTGESSAVEDPPRLHAGVSLGVADPVGEFGEYVKVGGGISGFFRVSIDPQDRVGLRIHAGFLNYGNETKRICLSPTIGCRIEVDLTTSNNIFFAGFGPELGFRLGPSRLHGTASIGFGYFSTDSQVQGSSGQDPFASSHNYGDGGFSWTAGGGLEIPVARAERFPISLHFALTYHGNGQRQYLTSGGIIDLPDGSIDFDVKRSDAAYALWEIGASIGITPESTDPDAP